MAVIFWENSFVAGTIKVKNDLGNRSIFKKNCRIIAILKVVYKLY